MPDAQNCTQSGSDISVIPPHQQRNDLNFQPRGMKKSVPRIENSNQIKGEKKWQGA
jgi:hypothetical protein